MNRISIDNLTICGYCSKYIFNDLKDNPIVQGMYETSNKMYQYNFVLIGGGFIQIKHPNEWDNPETKPMRFEFNPNNYLDLKNGFKSIKNILKRMYDVHITRKDIAIDFFDINMNDFLILDQKRRKQREYRKSNYEMETLYLGVGDSDEQIRIYNKAIEKDIDSDITWWRIEAQMRNDLARIPYYNPFEHISITRKQNFDGLKFHEKATLMVLQAEPTFFKELSKNARTKYKKMLLENVDCIKLEVEKAFNENAVELAQMVDNWLAFTGENLNDSDKRIPFEVSKKEWEMTEQEKEYYQQLAKRIKIERAVKEDD